MTASRIAAGLSALAKAAAFSPEQARKVLDERAARAAGKRDLCIMACVFCKDPLFWAWLQQQIEAVAGPLRTKMDEAGAKAFITSRCRVSSRTALDTDPDAATRFHDLIRLPFIAWKEAQHG